MLMLVGDWSEACQGLSVRGPEDLGPPLSKALGGILQEALLALAVGVDGRVTACDLLALGSANVARSSPRDVFRRAVAEGAASVVLAHNHPSDSTRPSEADIELTQRMLRAGAILDVELLDHLIVTARSWRSLRESTDLWSQPRVTQDNDVR